MTEKADQTGSWDAFIHTVNGREDIDLDVNINILMFMSFRRELENRGAVTSENSTYEFIPYRLLGKLLVKAVQHRSSSADEVIFAFKEGKEGEVVFVPDDQADDGESEIGYINPEVTDEDLAALFIEATLMTAAYN